MAKKIELNKVFAKPTVEDLTITGYLDSIKVNQTSFTVFYQFYILKEIYFSYAMQSRTFPLSYIQDFFKANADTPSEYLCPRRPEVD